ncbi:MAG: hypothetical protein AAB270_03795 [Chloroflexota bacterium]
MTKRYYGGDKVKGGAYVNLRTAEFTSIPKGGGTLPGALQARYIRVPAIAVVFAGPLMGLAFVILLPLAGVLAIPVVLYRVLQRVGREMGRALVRGAVPGWVPGAAYLVRRGPIQKAEPPREAELPEKADVLAALEAEMRRQRRQGKQ